MTPPQLRLWRSLAILRRLQLGSSTRDDLTDAVERDLIAQFGPELLGEIFANDIVSQFKNDIKFLRNMLGVQIAPVDMRTNEYVLEGFGDLRPLCLSEDEVDAMAVLVDMFGPELPYAEKIQPLLRRIIEMLSADQQTTIQNRRAPMLLDLGPSDGATVAPRVQRLVAEAIGKRRELQFAYRTAGQIDQQARLHTVQPYQLVWGRGHLYLEAYWLTSSGPLGKFPQGKWQSFRADRMLDDEHLRLLPSKLPTTLPRRPRYPVEYQLSPRLAGLGQVTRHFDEMQVHETDEDGWVRITGTTDSLFEATRILIRYGANCRVVGGSKLKAEMTTLIRELAGLYHI